MLSTYNVADSSDRSLLTVEHSWQTFHASQTVSGVGAERPLQGLFVSPPPPPTCAVAADVSSRSARGHATEAVVAVCWRSRQRGSAARAVQTPHGSARRHVDHPESQHPESGAREGEKGPPLKNFSSVRP